VRALVLAAGLGTRLFPLTLLRAKPAIPFVNRPIIQYSLEMLKRAGIDECVVNLHHLPETVRQAVGAGFPGVHYSYEPEILGTGGAIAKIRDFLAGDDFVVCNGKIYFEEDLGKAVTSHKESGALATLVLVPFDRNAEFNPVFVDGRSKVKGFGPRYETQAGDTPFVFTGVHVLSPEILGRIPDGPSDTVRDLYLSLIREGKGVNAFISHAFWCEISTPRRYLEKSFEVLRRSEAQSNVISGHGTTIHSGAQLQDSILWNNVSIGEHAYLNKVIAVDNISIPANARFEESIITPLTKFEGVLQSRGGRRDRDLVIWPL